MRDNNQRHDSSDFLVFLAFYTHHSIPLDDLSPLYHSKSVQSTILLCRKESAVIG